ncbi:MAG: hypothetical protein HYX78_15865 [Armatimonadetes bacterium]|nr:hypothetical protein [Armatimonadota bacterium]
MDSNQLLTKNKVAYVVATQHFDILWRRPVAYYRETQANVIKRVLRIIESYPEFRFAFHQANVLRHFVENHPEEAETLRRRVAEGVIEIVGGMEAVPDTNMVSGESLVRNIVYGRQWTREYFGTISDLGSMLDCFGSSAQLPQILAGTGHKALLAGRMPGIDLAKSPSPAPFVWEGLDNTSIRGIYLAFGAVPQDDLGAWYGWGVLEGRDEYSADKEPDPERFRTSFLRGLRCIMDSSDKGNAVMALLCGEEHLPRIELGEAVRSYVSENGDIVKFGTFGEFARAIDWGSVADRIQGEFNVEFSGCYTTRIKVKQLNQKAETALYNAEFLHAVGALKGRASYDPELLKSEWRDLFVCQFHDALCGCHIDDNYRHIVETFQSVLDGAASRIKESMVQERTDSSSCSDPKDGTFRVFNTLPYPRRDIVRVKSEGSAVTDACGRDVPFQRDFDEVVFLADLPPGGVSDYEMAKDGASDLEVMKSFPEGGLSIGNYRLSDDGAGLRVFEELLGRDLFARGEIPARLAAHEDIGNLWTEHFTGQFLNEEASDSVLEDITVGPLFARIVYSGQMPSQKASWAGLESLTTWRKTFYVYRHLDRIDLHIDLLYSGRGTEVRLVFPVNLNTSSALARYEIPFGSMVREPYGADKYEYGRGNWPALSWCDYGDEDFGVTLVHTGTPGCLAANGAVSFSLLRSATSWEKPLFPTEPEPLSFDNGRHHYEFALIPHRAGDMNWVQRAREFVVRPLTDAVTDMPSAGSDCFGGLNIEAPNVVLSTLKAAEDGKGVVLRMHEVLGKHCSTYVTFDFGQRRAIETSLDECRDGELVDLSCLKFSPFEMKTIRILPRKAPL